VQKIAKKGELLGIVSAWKHLGDLLSPPFNAVYNLSNDDHFFLLHLLLDSGSW